MHPPTPPAYPVGPEAPFPAYPQGGPALYAYGAPYPSVPSPAYAPWGARVLSALVDGLLPALVAALGLVALLDRALWPLLVVSYGGAFAVALGNSCVLQGRTGQSLGKRLAGTRLVRLRDGAPPGFWPTLARQLAHVLDALPLYAGYLRPLWDERRQTFADSVCETVVVRTAPAARVG